MRYQKIFSALCPRISCLPPVAFDRDKQNIFTGLPSPKYFNVGRHIRHHLGHFLHARTTRKQQSPLEGIPVGAAERSRAKHLTRPLLQKLAQTLPNPRSQHPSLAETLLYFATVIQGIDLQPFARHVM
jgi:hypothetical protein